MKSKLITPIQTAEPEITYPALFKYGVYESVEYGAIILVGKRGGTGICVYSSNHDRFGQHWVERNWETSTYKYIITPITIEYTP